MRWLAASGIPINSRTRFTAMEHDHTNMLAAQSIVRMGTHWLQFTDLDGMSRRGWNHSRWITHRFSGGAQ
jgi:hypothetical protein